MPYDRPEQPLPVQMTRPRALRAWLDGLPLADPPQASRLVLAALRRLQNQAPGARELFRALECLAPVVLALVAALARQYSGRPLPLGQRERTLVELSSRLQLEMAQAYQEVLAGSSRVFGPRWRRLVTTSLHRLFRLRSNILCNYRLCYLPYPPGVWKQLYWYYRLAEEHDLLGAKVAEPGSGRRTTVGLEFRRLLLLAMLSPNHLGYEAMEVVYRHLPHWAGLLVLQPPRQGGGGTFAIDLEGDEPPQHPPEGEVAPARWRCLDTRALVDDLSRRLVRPDDGVPEDVLRSLLAGWDRPPERSGSRRRTHSAVDVVTGVTAIHHVLAGGRPLAPATEDGDEEEVSMIPAGTVPGWHAPARSDAFGFFPATLLDASHGGYCLSLRPGEAGPLRLDELVALRDPRGGQWVLGQIRWMQAVDEDRLRTGVMLLSRQALPVCARPAEAEAPAYRGVLGLNHPRPVLYLPRAAAAAFGSRWHLAHAEDEMVVTVGGTFAEAAHFLARELAPSRPRAAPEPQDAAAAV